MRTLVALILAPSVALARPAPADPAWVGHYYLQGVMETGSELLLRPDGTFEWMLAYGALDQYAQGRWESDGTAVTLRPTQPDSHNGLPPLPFAVLRLRIAGRDLIPEALGRGRYTRGAD